MTTVTLTCRREGFPAQVQDLGREEFRALGVPVGGAMDRQAARLANWLVGNRLDGPVLEVALWGPRIAFDLDCQLSLTGADLSPCVNGEEVAMYETVSLSGGSELTFGEPRWGCRTYLAVAGDWQIDPWLGSCAAAPVMPNELTPGSVFGLGDELKVKQPADAIRRTVPRSVEPPHARPFRVLPGPEHPDFSASAIADFFSRRHEVSPMSNRMAYRLASSLAGHLGQEEMISSAVVPGTVQVIKSGEPIVLMADAQTIGGYPRLANVITADLDRLAQVRPGDQIGFVRVEPLAAVELLRQKQREESAWLAADR